jgi:glycosyltransferase involved in cell wall biosynthesis
MFTDSEFSKGELQSRMGVAPARVRVIAPGVTSPSLSPPTASPEGRAPMVLFVGTLFNRRRLPDLIAAFAHATADLPDARLVLVGADRTWPPQDLRFEASSRGIAHKVQLLDYVSNQSLADLYARASVFAFLSEYEGFGLTPLEALAAGVPIVVLDTAVAREVYGPAAEYVRCGDVAGAAAAIKRFIKSPAAAREQLAQAPAVLARYSWERAADETLRQIEAVVGTPVASAFRRKASAKTR